MYQRDEPALIGPWSLTLTNVISGDEAKAKMSEWSSGNPEAPPDLTYIIAQVAAENTGTVPRVISLADFKSAGADGALRQTPTVVIGDQAMRGYLAPGDVVEGWIPLLVDDPSVATLWYESTTLGGNWATAIFALTPSSVVPSFAIPSVTSSDLGKSPESPAELGQSVYTGGWQIILSRTLEGQEIYDIAEFELRSLGDSLPEDIPNWFAVFGSITNCSDQSAYFSSSMLEITDASGESWDHILALTPPRPDLSCHLLPGASHEGWAAFARTDYGTNGAIYSEVAMIKAQPSRISDEPKFVRISNKSNSSITNDPAGSSSAPRPFEPDDVVTVSGDPVNLRTSASTTGAIIVELPVGTELTIVGAPIEADGYWWFPVKVTESGEEGYVVQDYLSNS